MASIAGDSDPDRRIKELEAQIKEQELIDKRSVRPLFVQSFLTGLPIILTIGLGFAANYFQSQAQHREQLEILKTQGDQEQLKQERSARAAETARHDEAQARLDQQRREFDANASAAERRYTQEQATLRVQQAAQAAQQAREFAQSSERQRRQNEADLILQVIRVGDLRVASANIDFLLRAGLVRDQDGRIARATAAQPPVLPTASGAIVQLPDSQSAAGRRVIEALAPSGVAGANAASVQEPLRRLIDAMRVEREQYSVRELAVILALVEEETGGSFRSGEERCSPALVANLTGVRPSAGISPQACFELLYGADTGRGRRIGNINPGDGYRFRGRGYFVVTGRANYQRAATQWNTDYVAQPDLLIEPVHGFRSVLTFADGGLRAMRARPDFAADPEHFDYSVAVPRAIRMVRGGYTRGTEQIIHRTREIEEILRRELAPAR